MVFRTGGVVLGMTEVMGSLGMVDFVFLLQQAKAVLSELARCEKGDEKGLDSYFRRLEPQKRMTMITMVTSRITQTMHRMRIQFGEEGVGVGIGVGIGVVEGEVGD